MSLLTINGKYSFVCFLAVCVSSFVSYLFKSFTHFYSVVAFIFELYKFFTNTSLDICFVNTVFSPVAYLFS